MIGLMPEVSAQWQCCWCDSMPCFVITDPGTNPFIDPIKPVTLEVQGKQNVSKLCHDTAMSFGLIFSKSTEPSNFMAGKELSFRSLHLRQKGKGVNKLSNVTIEQTQINSGKTYLLLRCN